MYSTKPYRQRNLGSQSLQYMLDAAAKQAKPTVKQIYLHVQVSNADARRFYERFGFQEDGLVKDYYKKIAPHDAWILKRDIQSSS